jgi:hypothetical protein
MAGVPLPAVQVLVGHKCIETTLRYSHLGDTHLHIAVEPLTEAPTDTKTSAGRTSTPTATFAESGKHFGMRWCPEEDSNLHDRKATSS